MAAEFLQTAGNDPTPPVQAGDGAASIIVAAALLIAMPGSIGPASAAKFEPRDASALADACTSCHGINGHSTGRIPSIGGLSRQGLIESLKAYRATAGDPTIMNRIARGYSDAEIDALADYFSSAGKP
jgi:sulfide dehydrogenase cytochrome subunit